MLVGVGFTNKPLHPTDNLHKPTPAERSAFWTLSVRQGGFIRLVAFALCDTGKTCPYRHFGNAHDGVVAIKASCSRRGFSLCSQQTADIQNPPCLKVQQYEKIAAITGAQKLMMGSLVAKTGQDEGYLPLNQMSNIDTASKWRNGIKAATLAVWSGIPSRGKGGCSILSQTKGISGCLNIGDVVKGSLRIHKSWCSHQDDAAGRATNFSCITTSPVITKVESASTTNIKNAHYIDVFQSVSVRGNTKRPQFIFVQHHRIQIQLGGKRIRF